MEYKRLVPRVMEGVIYLELLSNNDKIWITEIYRIRLQLSWFRDGLDYLDVLCTLEINPTKFCWPFQLQQVNAKLFVDVETPNTRKIELNLTI